MGKKDPAKTLLDIVKGLSSGANYLNSVHNQPIDSVDDVPLGSKLHTGDDKISADESAILEERYPKVTSKVRSLAHNFHKRIKSEIE